MFIYDSKRWMADLDETIAGLPLLDELAGKAVLITGATGLVCSPVADLFLRYNETHAGKIRVLAAGRSLEKMRARFGDGAQREDFVFVPYDAAHADSMPSMPCDYIIHGASNAFPALIFQEPVETMLSNVFGVRDLLEYARTCGVRRLLYVSSSEVYGQKHDDRPFRENEYGAIDPLNPRNSYSIGKCAAETLCVSYAAEYGVSSVIARLGHIYGPTASPSDNRVSSAWAWAAARTQDLVMKSDGSQLRSYCHCLDCATAMITVMLRGADSTAYNIANPDSRVTIRQMAELLANAAGIQLRMELPSETEKRAFNPMPNSSLDSSALCALGWRGQYRAQEGFAETVEVMREMMAREGAERCD